MICLKYNNGRKSVMGEFPNKATQFSSTNQPDTPGGVNKKGKKHLSTHIQDLLNDEEFEANILDSKVGVIQYKGAPVKAIIQVAIRKAAGGDTKWADWLAKYGYGTKFELEHSGEISTGEADPHLAKEFANYLKQKKT